MLNSYLAISRNGLSRLAKAMLPIAVLGSMLGGLAGCAEGRETADLAALGPYRPLAPFYQALRAGRGRRVAVLQIGDSHTANDGFSGRLRELMQQRFGDGGRGMLPPGIPFDYYRPAMVHVSADGWQVVRSGIGTSARTGRFGLAGLRQHADGPATMTVEAEPGQLARAEVALLAQPGGGGVELVASDGRRESVSTQGDRPLVIRLALPEGGDATSVRVVARGDGPVDVLSMAVGRRSAGGVTWSNLGTIGAQIEIVSRWDPALMRAEAAEVAPSLVVVAFGTNEGFKDSLDLAAYPGQVRAALRRARAIAPGAALMVLGPVGGVRALGSGQGVACPGRADAVPVNLPKVRAVLRRVAAAEGAYFWDWSAPMGGDCAMADWAETDPPLAARDHVHLLKPGYRRTAEALFDDLMAGYARYAPDLARR